MADRVELAFRRASARLVGAHGSVLAAVSGGADSVALLRLLAGRAGPSGVRVAVAHLDHGLRSGSDDDRRFVERLATDLGVPFVTERREVDNLRRRDESPEEASRRVRRAFLLEVRERLNFDRIATGHTLDDQAETILFRLVRGAGSTALTGMDADGPGPFVRPLLGIERDELRGYLARKGFAFREDPSNRDRRFDRNRLRHDVLPLLTEVMNPRAAVNLVRSAGLLRDDTEYLDGLARRTLDSFMSGRDPGGWVLDVARLRRRPAVIARRWVRLALERAGVDTRRIGSRHIDSLLALAEPGPGRQAHLPSGWLAERCGASILLRPRETPADGGGAPSDKLAR